MTNAKPTTVVIAEDHAIVREGCFVSEKSHHHGKTIGIVSIVIDDQYSPFDLLRR